MCCPLNSKTKARRVQEGAPGRYKPCSGRWTMPNSCRGRAKPFFQHAKYWQVATSATFLPSVTGFVGWAEHIDRWAEHIDLVFSSKMLAAEFYYHGVSTKVVVVFIIAKPVLHSLRGLVLNILMKKKLAFFHNFMTSWTFPLPLCFHSMVFPLHSVSTLLVSTSRVTILHSVSSSRAYWRIHLVQSPYYALENLSMKDLRCSYVPGLYDCVLLCYPMRHSLVSVEWVCSSRMILWSCCFTALISLFSEDRWTLIGQDKRPKDRF